MKSKTCALVVSTAVFFFPISALSICEDCPADQTGPTVYVTGTIQSGYSPYTTYRISSVPSLQVHPAILTYQYYTRRVNSETWIEYMADLRDAFKRRKQTSDYRCSDYKAIAGSLATTTSHADNLDRYHAAAGIFNYLKEQSNMIGLKAAISNSRPAFRDGILTKTFTMTYIDGGTERWFIDSGMIPQMIEGAFEDGSRVLGSNTIQECPIVMEG